MKATVSIQQSLQRVGENLFRSDSSKVYYAIFKRDGKQIRHSLKTRDRALARRRLKDFREKVQRVTSAGDRHELFAEYDENGALIGGVARRWVELAAVRLKPASLDRRVRTIRMLSRYLKGKTIGKISRLDVERWAVDRAAKKAARTFNMELETLRLVFDYAVSHGIILDNPAMHVDRRKQSRPKLLIPTREQFRDILATIRKCRTMTESCTESEAAANLVEFLGYSGCRLAEVVGDKKFGKEPLLWRDVNFALKMFTVTGKGVDAGKTRTVPLFPPLERLLTDLKAKQAGQLQPADPIFNIQSAKKAIQTACRRLGLPKYHHHTFRHFFASNAIEQGVDFKVIAEWLGHADGGVLVARTYGHLRAEHSTAMAKKMTFDAAADEPDNVVRLKQDSGE